MKSPDTHSSVSLVRLVGGVQLRQPSDPMNAGKDRSEPIHVEAMFPEEVLQAFTAETGIKINYSNFDFDETMLAKLEAAKAATTMVIADDYHRDRDRWRPSPKLDEQDRELR